MKFTLEQLQLISEGKSVGDSFPYKNGSEEDIENYLKRLCSRLNQSGRLVCDGEFDHYGSGYASFVEFFCLKKDGSSILSQTEMNEDFVRSEELEGISLYVSRLAPVAVLGWSERAKLIREEGGVINGSYSGFTFLNADSLGGVPAQYNEELEEIKGKLAEAGYTILEKEEVEATLPFKTNIPTILTLSDFGEEYKIFDAIFYWED